MVTLIFWHIVIFTHRILSFPFPVCKQMLALPPYGKISASSEKHFKKGSSCLAQDGHIMTNKGWCAKDNNGKPGKLWAINNQLSRV